MLKSFCSLLMVFFLSEIPHKFYVSTTVVFYKEEEKALQITSQIFIDDLELALQEQYPDIRLAPDSNKNTTDSLMIQYFNDHLEFKSAKTILPMRYLGREYKNDIAVHYIEIKSENSLEKLQIENRILLSLFEDQKNIVHFKHKQIRKSFLLDKNNPYISLILEN